MQVKKVSAGYLLRLERGERVRESIVRFLKEHQIFAGLVQGIGALEQVELGYFSLPERRYLSRTMSGIFELLSFTGNVSLVDGEPFLHAHAVLSDAHFRTLGGHFFDALVAVTMELVVLPFSEKISRSRDEDLQLMLLDLAGEEQGG